MEAEAAIVDLEGLLRGDAAALEQVAAEIARPCAEWGLFHVVGHGIPDATRAIFEEALRAFFALPAAELASMRRSAENAWGYHDAELTKNRRDWKEIFDFGFERRGQHSDGRNQFRAGALAWKPALLAYRDACEPIARGLTRALCRALDLPADTLDAEFSAHTSFLRLNRYRPCSRAARPDSALVPQEGELGVHHHTDAGALTLLLQSGVAGLQVARDGAIYDVPPVPDALTVNLGDMLQVWSNDRFVSPIHRVLANPDQDRYSAPFFWNPNYATVCRPLVDSESPRFRDVSWAEFRSARSDGDYADLGTEIQIDQFRIGAGEATRPSVSP
ncbi:MAG: 2OG-Fe(II) oxygenase family protein [Myxococcota bacterium]